MYSNAHDGVTYVEVCAFIKNSKIWILWERNILFSYEKIHSLYIDNGNMAKNNFPLEVTLKWNLFI